jgi:hypothetical protein
MSKHQEHAHRYVRIKLGKKDYKVFRCVRPGCAHYIRQELVVGKIAQCWRCDDEFVMNQKTAQLKKPHCAKCTNSPNSRPEPMQLQSVEARQEMLRRLFKNA